ncbi:MAG: hypothetical protein HXN90_06495 [Prevotella pallens]|nr:hypothetical protein [Prevotella pallens]
MWKCVLGYGNTHFWLCKNTGTMNRSPTPDGMFAPHFVGERWYFTEYLLRYSNSFDTLL